MQENNIEEGVEILDPEMKAKQEEADAEAKIRIEKMGAMNKDIAAALKEISLKHGLKLLLAISCEELNEVGIWKSENVNALDELGLCKLIETQY